MKFKPITVTFSRHELEAVYRLADAAREKGKAHYAGTLDYACDAMLAALNEAGCRANDQPLFQAFWSANQHLTYGEARDAWRSQPTYVGEITRHTGE